MHREGVDLLGRRQFLKGSAALAALAGLRTHPAPARALAQGQTTISVLSADWGGNYNELLTKIGDAFTEQNPNIAVEWEFSPTVHDEFLTRMAGGTPPPTWP